MGLAREEQGIVERKAEKLAGESSGVLKEVVGSLKKLDSSGAILDKNFPFAVPAS